MIPTIQTALTILSKELLSHWRDRRSLLASLVIPVMGPLAFFLIFSSMASWMRSAPVRLAVHNDSVAPALMASLRSQGILPHRVEGSPEEAVKQGREKLCLILPDDFGTSIRRGTPAVMTLVVDRSRNDTAKDIQRVQLALSAWSQKTGALRLLARGVNPSLAQPLVLNDVDVATPAQRAAQLLAMLPLFLMMSVFMGSLNLVIDTTAGERERGSLEPLLLTAAPRGAITLGKWGAAVLLSMAIVVLTMLGFSIAIALSPLQNLGISFTLGPSSMASLIAILTPLCLMGTSLELLVATSARTTKEAQTWLSFFSLLPTIPAMVVIFHPFDSALWMNLIPVLSQQMLILDVMKQNPISPVALAILWGSSVACTAIALARMKSLLKDERIVYGR